MDRQSAVSMVHLLLASSIAIVAVIGLFGTSEPAAGRVAVESQLSLLIVLPLAGSVALGLADWQMGRGPLILRTADAFTFLMATVELSLGVAGPARWAFGTMAILAATGLAASFLVAAPRRPGFRR